MWLATTCVRRLYAASAGAPKVAVVLSGCGVYDGSEIHEASSTLIHLTRGGAQPMMFAPNMTQMHVVNHTKGEPVMGVVRNVLEESARIARGKIQPLTELHAGPCDAVVFPGGFGAAKNLSNFAVDGAQCKIDPEVERVIKEFHAAKKPIALCCIAPILAAKVLGNIQITLGQDKDDGSGKWPYASAVEAVTSWGTKHQNRNVDGCVVDQMNKIVTAPAFMYETPNFHEIYDSVGKMISALLQLLKQN